MGEDRKLVIPFAEFAVGVGVIIGVAVGVAGVAVGVVCVHHWFIEEASKADTLRAFFCRAVLCP